jgi:hypothetical protein
VVGLVVRALGADAIVLLLALSAILVGAAQQTLP